MKENTIIKELKILNEVFLENNCNGRKVNQQNYLLKKGEVPILISAPHAVKQIREEKVKPSDYLTGPLAIYLANKCHCSYLVRCFNNQDDPNYPIGKTLSIIHSEYLMVLMDFIQKNPQYLVIDLHGCRNERKCDCSIWSDNLTLCDNHIVDIFQNQLEAHSLSVDRGSEFLGGQVTRQAGFLTNAFQLEIKKNLRSMKEENYPLLESFLTAMKQAIMDSNQHDLSYQKRK